MTVTPKRIPAKTVVLSNTDIKDGVALVDLSFGANNEVKLIISNEILIRYSIKKEEADKFLEKIKADCVKGFKLLGTKNHSLLREILLSESEIRTKINKDKGETFNRPSSEETDYIGGIERRGMKMQESGKKLGLMLCRQHKEFYCDKCHAFRPGPGLSTEDKIICLKCKNLLKSKLVYHLPTNVFAYLNGFWLEDYIAHILSSMGWVAWSSPNLYVYGVSGFPHQIDVLAIKDGRIMVVECKTGEVNQNQVKNMLAKYYDIRCHHALLVSLDIMNSDAKKIIEKNPAIKFCDNIKGVTTVKRIISKI